MEGLGFVIIILLILYFFSFLFTFLVIVRILKIRPAAGVVIAMLGMAALFTTIVFWTKWYTALQLGFVLVYFVVIVAVYIVYAGFFSLRKKKDV